MKTNFTPEQLQDPAIARANDILRSCVHCGFCTATCPTYQVLGDELDSPRGRIYLIKDMLENNRKPDALTVKHIDRCLSCLACMTTCPSGVHYMHLVDQAREYIQQNHRRPLFDRVLRNMLAQILPYPNRFRWALRGAKVGRIFKRLMPDPRLRAMLDMVPRKVPSVSLNDTPQSFSPIGQHKYRVALMTGCAQRALNTDINDATIRVLQRLGCEVVIAEGMGCCGALTHHMGKTTQSHSSAETNTKVWMAEHAKAPLDAIIINTSGCGTTVKDYGYMLADTDLAAEAKTVSALACDISEFLTRLEFRANAPEPLTVAYHAACSLQHGQQVKSAPKDLLRDAGFIVAEPKDAHLCCGSAGTYNLLQPKISGELKARKLTTLGALQADVIASGNIGCMMQIGSGTNTPIVHTVELIDWATGGPKPPALAETRDSQTQPPSLS